MLHRFRPLHPLREKTHAFPKYRLDIWVNFVRIVFGKKLVRHEILAVTERLLSFATSRVAIQLRTHNTGLISSSLSTFFQCPKRKLNRLLQLKELVRDKLYLPLYELSVLYMTVSPYYRNSPRASGDRVNKPTLPAPALFPPIVTDPGSPRKFRIFSWIHLRAWIWSRNP